MEGEGEGVAWPPGQMERGEGEEAAQPEGKGWQTSRAGEAALSKVGAGKWAAQAPGCSGNGPILCMPPFPL